MVLGLSHCVDCDIGKYSAAGSDAAPSDTEIGGWQYGFHLTRPNDGTIDGCVFRGNFASSEAQQSLTHAIHVETSDYACNLLVNNCMRIHPAISL